MEINYKANPTFRRIHRDKSKFIFVMGPVGSGKSSGCIMHLAMHAMRQAVGPDGIRRSKYAIIRSTYPALKTTVVKSWIGWFKDKIKIVYDTPIRGEIRFGMPDGTSVEMDIEFVAVNDDAAVEKLRSSEYTAAHFNEASELTPELFDMMKTRIGRYPSKADGGPIDPFILFDYNAVSTDHWLYKLAEEDKPEKHSFYKQPPAVLFINGQYIVNREADNVENLPDDYYLDMIAGSDPDFINVNVMNNYGEVRRGRPVYKDYDDHNHCAEKPFGALKGIHTVIGVDQGLTPAAVFIQQAPDGTIQVFDELVTEDCSLREFADLLWAKIHSEYPEIQNNFSVIVDPATTQRSQNDAKAGTDILREAGLPFRVAKTNVATERRESVIHFLRLHKKFALSPKCKMLRKGFISEYKYDEIRNAQAALFKDKPAKNEYSHPHDALQYGVMEYFRRPKNKVHYRKTRYRAASNIGGY